MIIILDWTTSHYRIPHCCSSNRMIAPTDSRPPTAASLRQCPTRTPSLEMSLLHLNTAHSGRCISTRVMSAMSRKRERRSESCCSCTEDGEEVRGSDTSSEEDVCERNSEGSSGMLSDQVRSRPCHEPCGPRPPQVTFLIRMRRRCK